MTKHTVSAAATGLPTTTRRAAVLGAIASTMIGTVAVAAALPPTHQIDPFMPLLARYLKRWGECPCDNEGPDAENAWNDEITEMEDELNETMPTTKQGALAAVRFIATRAPLQSCQALDCQHALLMAAADILAA